MLLLPGGAALAQEQLRSVVFVHGSSGSALHLPNWSSLKPAVRRLVKTLKH
jgi:hypothetical protein